MIYNPENVKLVITHNGVEQEINILMNQHVLMNVQQYQENKQNVYSRESQRLKRYLRNQNLSHHVVKMLQIGLKWNMVMSIRSPRKVRLVTDEY